MIINTAKEGNICILNIEGRLDAATSPQLEKEIKSMLEGGEINFVMELSKLEYISSVGLRVLLMTTKKAGAAGGKVTLCALQEHVQEVFEIAGFTAIFPVFSTRDEAVNAI